MCLLHTHPLTTAFDFDDIADFYSHNSDGLGIMFAEDGVLHIKKILPKNAEEAWAFYQAEILGRECVVHWRMKTHGDIDLENCHPYTIFDGGSEMPMAMMHNGILSQGNAKDKSKSDTWHYVQDILVPLLSENPSLAFNPAMKTVLESDIGNGNRFAIMNNLGQTVILNDHQFVDYKGALLSNTYAWDSSKGGYGFKRGSFALTGYSTGRSLYSGLGYDDDDAYGQYWHDKGMPKSETKTTTAKGEIVEGNFRNIQDEAEAAEAEARQETQAFFDALEFHNLMESYRELTFLDVVDFLAKNTSSVLWDALDAVLNGEADEEEMFDYIIEGTTKSMREPLGISLGAEADVGNVATDDIPNLDTDEEAVVTVDTTSTGTKVIIH